MGELYRNPSTSSLRASTAGELIFYNDVLNEKMHSLELTNWLNHND